LLHIGSEPGAEGDKKKRIEGRKDRFEKWSQETLGIPCFSSLDEAVAKTSGNSVLVVTNPGQHKPVILEALRLNKPVLVEKPMVTSVQEADEIAAAAENSGVNVMAAQGYRFLHAAGFIRERVAAGDIGELQGVKIRFRRYVPDVLSNPEHSLYALPHSILLDMSVHHFDLLRYITQKEPVSVVAMEHDTPDNAFKHPSNAICLVRLERNIPVVWDGDWCARGPATTSWEGEWQLIGTKARLFLGWKYRRRSSHIRSFGASRATPARTHGLRARLRTADSDAGTFR
jgi:predicted dehydrogenase